MCRVLRGEQDGLRRLKLRVEDPPRRRHMVSMEAGRRAMGRRPLLFYIPVFLYSSCVPGLHTSPTQHARAVTTRLQVFAGAAVLADIMRGQDAFWISKAEWAEDPHRAMAKCSGLGS